MPRLEDMTEDERGRLRDEFAKAALPLAIDMQSSATFTEECEVAYQIADAMLAARDGGRGDG